LIEKRRALATGRGFFIGIVGKFVLTQGMGGERPFCAPRDRRISSFVAPPRLIDRARAAR
jgi:hypothetical protein